MIEGFGTFWPQPFFIWRKYQCATVNVAGIFIYMPTDIVFLMMSIPFVVSASNRNVIETANLTASKP